MKKHIFPGGHLPSFKRIESILKKEKIGKSYAKTLEEWRLNFINNEKALKELGLNDEFLRKWLYYFSYCEAGFRIGRIDDYQILLKRGPLNISQTITENE